jgi:hypothetical protein
MASKSFTGSMEVGAGERMPTGWSLTKMETALRTRPWAAGPVDRFCIPRSAAARASPNKLVNFRDEADPKAKVPHEEDAKCSPRTS